MLNQKAIHDDEWRKEWKSSDTVFHEEGRFELIKKIISPLAPKAIFDLGCSNGYQAEIMKKAIPNITVNGYDISPSAIEKAKKHIGLLLCF